MVSNGENSLRHFGPIVWNTMLPEKLKWYSRLAEFRNSINNIRTVLIYYVNTTYRVWGISKSLINKNLVVVIFLIVTKSFDFLPSTTLLYFYF